MWVFDIHFALPKMYPSDVFLYVKLDLFELIHSQAIAFRRVQYFLKTTQIPFEDNVDYEAIVERFDNHKRGHLTTIVAEAGAYDLVFYLLDRYPKKNQSRIVRDVIRYPVSNPKTLQELLRRIPEAFDPEETEEEEIVLFLDGLFINQVVRNKDDKVRGENFALLLDHGLTTRIIADVNCRFLDLGTLKFLFERGYAFIFNRSSALLSFLQVYTDVTHYRESKMTYNLSEMIKYLFENISYTQGTLEVVLLGFVGDIISKPHYRDLSASFEIFRDSNPEFEFRNPSSLLYTALPGQVAVVKPLFENDFVKVNDEAYEVLAGYFTSDYDTDTTRSWRSYYNLFLEYGPPPTPGSRADQLVKGVYEIYPEVTRE